jgi:hypothetical protein
MDRRSPAILPHSTRDVDSLVWVCAIYEKDGCVRLERTGHFGGSTSLTELIEWASTFETPDLRLVRIEVEAK